MSPCPPPIRLRAHVHEELLPLWDRHGWDARHGGFHSRLDHQLRPVADGYKRMMVQMRQLYCYAEAGHAGAGAWAAERADAVYAHVLERFWDPVHGGWFLTTTPEGEPLDPTKDTYAHAFALLGLASYHRLRPTAGALERAHTTLDLIEKHLGDARHGGFFESASRDWTPAVGPRRHNPHMHLLEALLSLARTSDEPRFLHAAGRLVELFAGRLYPEPRLALPETFEPDWTPSRQPGGADVEPGHHFEWYWLLAQAREAGVRGAGEDLVAPLFDFAFRHGVDPADGAVLDRLDLAGRTRADRKRVWPQTEYAKALGVRLERGAPEPAGKALERLLELCFARYVHPGHAGWMEHADRSGKIVSEAMNASTLYHVAVAIEECARALAAGDPESVHAVHGSGH